MPLGETGGIRIPSLMDDCLFNLALDTSEGVIGTSSLRFHELFGTSIPGEYEHWLPLNLNYSSRYTDLGEVKVNIIAHIKEVKHVPRASRPKPLTLKPTGVPGIRSKCPYLSKLAKVQGKEIQCE